MKQRMLLLLALVIGAFLLLACVIDDPLIDGPVGDVATLEVKMTLDAGRAAAGPVIDLPPATPVRGD